MDNRNMDNQNQIEKDQLIAIISHYTIFHHIYDAVIFKFTT